MISELNRVELFAGWRLRNNIYWILLLCLTLIMLLFSICRIGFYLFNFRFFPGLSVSDFLYLMWGGLRFDLAAVLYVNMLFIVMMILPFNFRFRRSYQLVVKYLFLISNGIALAMNVADFIYYRFTLRRTTADVFTQFENEQNMGSLFFHFLLDYWYAVLFWVMLMVVLVWVYNRLKVSGPLLKNRWVYYSLGVVTIPLIAWLIIGGVRGGFRHSTRPITLSNAGEYVKDPRDISIVLNTPFAVFRTVGKTKVQKLNFFSDQEVEKIYSPIHTSPDTGSFRQENVVIIILESFSREFIGALNQDKQNGNYKGYTPFLDSLIQFSKTWEYSFANGRKSIDGLPSVVSSIPALGVPYFLSPYSTNRITSLASLLKEKGYHSSFFHGAPNGSMGFNAFMNIAGFQHYYGMSECNNSDDFDGIWGVWDDKFFTFYADKLNTFQQPFVSAFFSVSSHHPFKIPEVYESRFKGGHLPIQKCIQYTDFSLRNFFNSVSKMPWYENTLFVITADHTSSDIHFDESRTAWGFFSVPIIFFKPDHSLMGRDSEIIQQIDIMPSVLGYLKYDKPYVAFGRNVFEVGAKPFAFNYKDNAYQLFADDYLLQFDGTRSIGLYNFKKDRLIRNNLINAEPELALSLEPKLKAIIQQYNNRMIEDRLTVGHQPKSD
ncbi:MAG: sulfatase-like hydrolase/transferase [Cyclobacteriaceae bacterium]|nr:sulfatase-like hydrolase/transferase [Cyclobacteriaceae bacterium]